MILPLILNLDYHNIILIVATLSSKLVSSMFVITMSSLCATVDLYNDCRDINKFVMTL